MGVRNGGDCTKQPKLLINISENTFPRGFHLRLRIFSEKIKEGKLFRYEQFDFEVPENLRANFANFLPIFKKTLVSKRDKRGLDEKLWR